MSADTVIDEILAQAIQDAKERQRRYGWGGFYKTDRYGGVRCIYDAKNDSHRWIVNGEYCDWSRAYDELVSIHSMVSGGSNG